MKTNIIIVIALAVAVTSCQKSVDAPQSANDLTASKSDAGLISPTPVATFDAAEPVNVRAAVANIIFADSFFVTENEAYLQAIKFNVDGKKLRFTNFSIYVNDVRSYVTGTYENGLITLVLNRKKRLPVGEYFLKVKARVGGPVQTFSLDVPQGNTIITDKCGFIANIIGLPLHSTVEIQK